MADNYYPLFLITGKKDLVQIGRIKSDYHAPFYVRPIAYKTKAGSFDNGIRMVKFTMGYYRTSGKGKHIFAYFYKPKSKREFEVLMRGRATNSPDREGK